MKILLCSSHPKPLPGAAWSRLSYFAFDWAKQGHNVSMLGSFTPKSYKIIGHRRIEQVDIFNIIPAISISNPIFFIINAFVSFMITLLFLAAKKPDAVIVSVPGGDAGIGFILACRASNSIHVIDYRDEWEDYNHSIARSVCNREFYHLAKALTSNLYLKSDYLITTTSHLLLQIRKRGIFRSKIITNGTDLNLFKPCIRTESNVIKLVYIGLIGGYYDFNTVIEAISLVISKGFSNVRLTLAGSGDVNRVLKLSQIKGIRQYIEYRGNLESRKEIAQLICRSHIGLIPYNDNPLWRNTISAKFYEYCGCGIPIVASALNDSILAKMIIENKIGSVVQPTDSESFAKTLISLMNNQHYREEAGANAYSLATKYDRNIISKKFLMDLIEIVHHKKQ